MSPDDSLNAAKQAALSALAAIDTHIITPTPIQAPSTNPAATTASNLPPAAVLPHAAGERIAQDAARRAKEGDAVENTVRKPLKRRRRRKRKAVSVAPWLLAEGGVDNGSAADGGGEVDGRRGGDDGDAKDGDDGESITAPFEVNGPAGGRTERKGAHVYAGEKREDSVDFEEEGNAVDGAIQQRATNTIDTDSNNDDENDPMHQLHAAVDRFLARTSFIPSHGDEGDIDRNGDDNTGESTAKMNETITSNTDETNDGNASNGNNDSHHGEQTDLNAIPSDTNKTYNDPNPTTPTSHPPPSRKRLKEQRRNLISSLKAIAPNPSLIDLWDTTSPNPLLLTTLKWHRNTVPVPTNWRQKRKYLQNKRGLEKRSLKLPAYITDLGLEAARDAQREADGRKTMKQRQRDRMRAKTAGSGGVGVGAGAEMDIRRFHDAFFKFQTRPRLTGLGDVYYELRELEVDAGRFVPGVLSRELRKALGMREEGMVPPPWLVAMQRWGPPPGWPGLKVAGVNVSIPKGGRFGYQAGEWGKVPVDGVGRPIYGDVFGQGLDYEGVDERFDLTEERKAWRWGSARVGGLDGGASGSGGMGGEGDGRVGEGVGGREQGGGGGGGDDLKEGEEGVDGGRGDGEGAAVSGERKLYEVVGERKGWVGGGSGGLMASSHVYEVRNGGGGSDGGKEVGRGRGGMVTTAGSGGRQGEGRRAFKF